MSKSETITCDRCGRKIVVVHNNWLSRSTMNGCAAMIKLWKPEDLRSLPGDRIDLCENCYQKFINFMETEVEE